MQMHSFEGISQNFKSSKPETQRLLSSQAFDFFFLWTRTFQIHLIWTVFYIGHSRRRCPPPTLCVMGKCMQATVRQLYKSPWFHNTSIRKCTAVHSLDTLFGIPCKYQLVPCFTLRQAFVAEIQQYSEQPIWHQQPCSQSLKSPFHPFGSNQLILYLSKLPVHVACYAQDSGSIMRNTQYTQFELQHTILTTSACSTFNTCF